MKNLTVCIGMLSVAFSCFAESNPVGNAKPSGPAVIAPLMELKGPRLCAHRGFPAVAPENSLAAYGAAVALDASEIEVDLWWTKDGEPVTTHDPRIDRVSNGTGHVTNLTYAALCELDFGEKVKGPHFKGLKIVHFRDLLRKLACQTIFNIHFKQHPSEERLQAFVELVREYGAAKHVFFQIDIESLHPVLERLAPEIARYQGRGAWFDIVDRAIKYRCKGVQCYKKCCNAEVVKKAHEAGLIVNLFWSNEPEEARELFMWGIDCLMTDDYQPISFATGVK